MASQNTRVILILLGAVIASLFLGSTAADARLRLIRAVEAAALVSLTPSHTITLTPTPTLTATVTRTPTATLTLTPTSTQPPNHSATAPRSESGVGTTQPPSPTPWPTPDSKARAREIKAPILMYHHVGPLPDEPDQIRIGLTVLPANFGAQLKFLKQRGYESIDFYQLYYAITLGWALPKKPVVFTFDDAYADIYDYALPIMRAYGYTGTVFVPTQFIDEGREGYMTWDQLMELRDAGWRLEPHTKTHTEVDGRGRDFLIYEIYGSMETLRYHLGYQPRFFAYPAGNYNDNAIAILKEVGYWGAVTTDSGWYHRLSNAYTWGRVRVGGRYVMQDFANTLGEEYP
ncbi:MAG: polysaccharide deacetylase family protein [Chloroflexi bacterium]|nr:polysaccharide deacetylase family protein [Chloroflexota bacterium]